jgi:hypothetical protein
VGCERLISLLLAMGMLVLLSWLSGGAKDAMAGYAISRAS